MQNDTSAQKLPTPPNDQALCLSPADVRKTLSRINPRKAAGPDNIPGRVLKDCAEQLTDVLTDIFNTSLSQAVIPPTLPHLRKKLLNFYFCAIQVSGPAQATCSNTLSSTCTRHFHTPLCVHNPTKD